MHLNLQTNRAPALHNIFYSIFNILHDYIMYEIMYFEWIPVVDSYLMCS